MTRSITREAPGETIRPLIVILAILALWALVPEVRRLVDWRAGFAAVSVVSIVPLAALVVPLLGLTYGGGLSRIDPRLLLIAWVWFGGFTAALAIGIASGNSAAAALYSYAEFCLPAAFGLWVASQRVDRENLFDAIARFLIVLATPISLYALIQFALAPAWDVAWMEHVRMTSIGLPAPYQFRPFSTLNSPGTFADFLLAVILFNLPRLRERRPVLMVQIALCSAALALTLVRSDWIALAVGVACFLALSPNRRSNLFAFTFAAAAVISLTLALPSLLGSTSFGATLSTRLSSFGELGVDASYAERAGYYGAPLVEAALTPQGSGLGVIGTAAKLGDTGTTRYFDNGYIARLTEMGWFGTACYLAGTFGALAFVLSLRRTGPASIVAAVAGIQLALLFSDASSDHHLALSGLIFWLSLALVTPRMSTA
jgi:hypothetical protein